MALPVYTSRQFRHGGMFVNAAAGVEKPANLAGGRIGMPFWPRRGLLCTAET